MTTTLAMPDLTEFHANLFNCEGRWEIQRDDESSPDSYSDCDALAAIIAAATSGNRDAIHALYLDGRPINDTRYFWPKS